MHEALSLPRYEDDPAMGRVYFKIDPDPETRGDKSVESIIATIAERFGHRVELDFWRGDPVFRVDCFPQEVPMVAGVVKEFGFWLVLEMRPGIALASSDEDEPRHISLP